MKHRIIKYAMRITAIGAAATVMLCGCGKAGGGALKDPEQSDVGAEQADGADGSGAGQQDAAGSEQNGTLVNAETLPPLNIIDDKYRTTYEIFVYSFYDSDGDGIGDLKGVLEKLDYINDGDDATDTDLGCNEIWLMPVAPSTTYHKYDVVDYKDIDPEYGTMEDFDALIKACHDRGIRVIVDTVFNHSSVEHPWFKEAAEYLKAHPGLEFADGDDAVEAECPYLDYYRFSNEKLDGYEPVPGTEYFYEARFWSGMPDLNLDSAAVRSELSDITQFWTDHGVDGLRLDATTYFYTGDDGKNIEFLTWLNDTVKKQNPEAYIVGEAWTNSATYTKYYESGVDSFFDFDYAGSEGIIAGVARGTTPASRYGEALVKTQEALAAANKNAIDAPFYTNHDMARSSGYFTGKNASDKLKLSAALNLLMPGNAFVYYGEELGMKGSGKDENKRAPMYWTAGEDGSEGAGTAAEMPAWLENVQSGMCKGPRDMDSVKMKYPALDEQYQDPYSIYNYYKAAIRMRNTYPCIARGTTSVVSELSGSDICAFVRAYEDEELLVVINTSTEPQDVDIASLGYVNLDYQLNTAEQTSAVADGKLAVAPFGVCVLAK